MRRVLLVLAALALSSPGFAQAAGPEQPPPPWFIVEDIPSQDPGFTTTRWLWNRDIHALRYCRQPVGKDAYACAPDVVMPKGRWVLQRLQDTPVGDVPSQMRFYSPDLDRTLICRANADGSASCE